MRYENSLSFGDFIKGIFTVMVVVFFLLAPHIYKKAKNNEAANQKPAVVNQTNV